jgi:hypothetical protein
VVTGFKGEPVEMPDLVEPIVGWRSWKFEYRNLASADVIVSKKLIGHFSYEWSPGVNVASCACGSTPSRSGALIDPSTAYVHAGFGCGFYFYKSLRDLAQDMHPCSGPIVVGLAKGWGKVYEHERGYRTEFAEIDKLYYGVGRPVHPRHFYNTVDFYGVDEASILDEMFRYPLDDPIIQRMALMLQPAFKAAYYEQLFQEGVLETRMRNDTERLSVNTYPLYRLQHPRHATE